MYYVALDILGMCVDMKRRGAAAIFFFFFLIAPRKKNTQGKERKVPSHNFILGLRALSLPCTSHFDLMLINGNPQQT